MVTLTKSGDVSLTKEFENLRMQFVPPEYFATMDVSDIFSTLDTSRSTWIRLAITNLLLERLKRARKRYWTMMQERTSLISV